MGDREDAVLGYSDKGASKIASFGLIYHGTHQNHLLLP
jgi:hypothetical protein